MDTGWAQFRTLYDFIPRNDREIALREGDILIVAKPFGDPKYWLVGKNQRTGQHGDFPGNYVEHIGDVDEIEDEEVEPEPEKPPPIPPRLPRQSTQDGHKLVKVSSSVPVFCNNCEDFIWGRVKEYFKCQDCSLTFHLGCATDLKELPCIKSNPEDENAYIRLVSSIDQWKIEDVMAWLATTNYYTYAKGFRDFGVDGCSLPLLNEESLVKIGVTDRAHQQSFLYVIQELFSSDSPERQSNIFCGVQKAPKGSDGGHTFKAQNFYSLQWCDNCEKCLWGLYDQGLQCTVCGLCCHRMCKRDGIPVCPMRRVKGARDSDVEDPVFGQELSSHFASSTSPAPIVVMKCVQAIEARGLKAEGIYSYTPEGPEKYSLRSALNQNPESVNMNDQEWKNAHCIAAVLKMYFQELPTCLFTEEKYIDFIAICQSNPNCIDNLLREIDKLPHPNKSVINYLMKHFHTVYKHQQYNKMSSLDLSRIFAHILLKPPKKDLKEMAANHEIQIQVIDTLINQGPWSVEEIPEEAPPAVPPRSHRVASKSNSFSAPDRLLDLKDQVWYWGEASKEQVQERMKDIEDGSFIVRDSKRFPGEYTLTLMKGGVTKLIRIMYRNNKYGFSEPLTFNSVTELVNYYKDRSLAQYNAKLDVRLTNPLSKYEQPIRTRNKTVATRAFRLSVLTKRNVGSGDESEEDEAAQHSENVTIIEDFESIIKELERETNNYEDLRKEYDESIQNIADLQLVLDAQKTVVSMIEEQIRIHESFQKEAPPQVRGMLRTNFELLKHRLNNAQCEILQSQRENSNITEESRRKDQQMNMLRSKIIELQKNKQRYADILKEKGYSQEEVKEIANEGIYQIPEIDMSEMTWRFGRITREESERLLKDCPDGTFMIRESINRKNEFSVSLSFDFKVRHIAIYNDARGYFGFAANFIIYETLADLVNHYHRNSLQKHNPHLATKLAFPVRLVLEQRKQYR